jgi:hypothetical protein
MRRIGSIGLLEPFVKHLALCLALVTFPASAETAGIRFDQMPIGCRIHGQYSTGEKVIDVYVGKSGSKHVMKTYQGPAGKKLIRTTTYSRDGLMLRKDWADGSWESFKPASCVNVPGRCNYTYRNSDGAELKYQGKNTLNGSQIVNEGRFVGEPPFAPVVSTLGRFNLQEAYVEGNTSFKVTKFENCEETSGA